MVRNRRQRRPPQAQRRAATETDDERIERLQNRTRDVEEHIAGSEELQADETRPPTRMTHKLAIPVRNLGQWVYSVEFRYPTFLDLEEAAKKPSDTAATRELIRRLTPLRGSAIDELSGLDVVEMTDIIEDFQTRRPEPEPESPRSSS